MSQRRPRPLVQVLRGMYWTWRKDRGARWHLLSVLLRAAASLLRIRARALLSRTPLVAISLVEHMGDIVAAEPLSRRARRAFPNARILWFARGPYLQLARRYPPLTGAVRVNCLTEWLLLWHSGAAGVAWDLHVAGRMCPRCKVPVEKEGRAAAATLDNYLHLGSLLAIQSICAGLDPIDDAPVLLPDADAARSLDGLGLPPCFVVIHCAANDATRDWTKENWALLVRHITNQLGLYVVEVGLVSTVVQVDTDRACSLCGSLSILQTAELIRRATLFVGVESGPAHVANAVGTQGVVLVGRLYCFEGYMPYSGPYATGVGATIVRADGPLASLPVGPVIEAVDARLGRGRVGQPAEAGAGHADQSRTHRGRP